jgi:predicted DNA-binding mobile mystery protein A
MNKTNRRAAQARRELDRRFRGMPESALPGRPHRGWIRAIRTALGMSQTALGARLGIAQSAVVQLEQAEVAGGITLGKLGEVAGALDCTLVYVLVPNTSLDDTLQREARRVAAERLGYIASTMALEDQSVGSEHQADQLDRMVDELITAGEVWSRSERSVPASR